jgi:phosphoserine phosphatase RsbU/P
LTIARDGQDHSVLVVDDDATNRVLYVALLSKAGYAVRAACSGLEALTMIEDERPSLVLLDFMMPGMDGSEVIQRLRGEPRTEDLPVIVLTASVSSEDIELALSSGADDYINKPVDSRILLTRIRSIIRAHHDRARAAAAPERDALRKELQEAQAVQRAQLPQGPVTWDGWCVVGAVVPSGQIAGDVFDVIRTGSHRGIALLVDVSGHGTASALVAAETRTGFRELVAERALGEAMAVLNRRMGERDTGKYSCVGAVEVCGRTVTVVNAGLPPIVVLRGGQQIRSVVGGGFPVGMFADSAYETVSFEAHQGDLIVMVSDGLTEPFGRSDDLTSALSQMNIAEAPPSSKLQPTLNARLLKVTRASTPELQDDATMVVLEAI